MILFGPVPSRRLGRSLGIDIVPLKCCSFDCVYCEVGKTTCHTFIRHNYVKYEDVIKELELFIEKGIPYDTLTFSGSGEPTLNSDIGKMISWMKKNTKANVALLTNSSLVDREEVREEIKACDIILPSLDAISKEVVKKLNNPASDIDMLKIVEGLHLLKKEMSGKMWLEVLLVKGYNDFKEEWLRLKEAIDYINPDIVDINTVVRPSRNKPVEPVSDDVLREFADIIGEKAHIIAPFKSNKLNKGNKERKEDIESLVIKTLEIRPCTIEELSASLNTDENEIKMILKEFVIDGTVKSELLNDQEFFYIEKKEK